MLGTGDDLEADLLPFALDEAPPETTTAAAAGPHSRQAGAGGFSAAGPAGAAALLVGQGGGVGDVAVGAFIRMLQEAPPLCFTSTPAGAAGAAGDAGVSCVAPGCALPVVLAGGAECPGVIGAPGNGNVRPGDVWGALPLPGAATPPVVGSHMGGVGPAAPPQAAAGGGRMDMNAATAELAAVCQRLKVYLASADC